MARTLLLSGWPGMGKTTVIKAIAQQLGERADGFYTEEIRVHGQRQGFLLRDLRGEQATLAHVQLKRAGGPSVGRYGVDTAALDRVGVVAMQRGLAQGQVIIVDEIGKMELFSRAFKAALLAVLDAQVPLIATVMARPHPWVDALKTRSEVTLWQVTLENRNALPSRVLDWLHSVTGDLTQLSESIS
jgi:nucleoside-triphosphatase